MDSRSNLMQVACVIARSLLPGVRSCPWHAPGTITSPAHCRRKWIVSRHLHVMEHDPEHVMKHALHTCASVVSFRVVGGQNFLSPTDYGAGVFGEVRVNPAGGTDVPPANCRLIHSIRALAGGNGRGGRPGS